MKLFESEFVQSQTHKVHGLVCLVPECLENGVPVYLVIAESNQRLLIGMHDRILQVRMFFMLIVCSVPIIPLFTINPSTLLVFTIFHYLHWYIPIHSLEHLFPVSKICLILSIYLQSSFSYHTHTFPVMSLVLCFTGRQFFCNN